jgi:hypothetical protein
LRLPNSRTLATPPMPASISRSRHPNRNDASKRERESPRRISSWISEMGAQRNATQRNATHGALEPAPRSDMIKSNKPPTRRRLKTEGGERGPPTPR